MMQKYLQNIPESIKNKNGWFVYNDNEMRKSMRDIVHLSEDGQGIEFSGESSITLVPFNDAVSLAGKNAGFGLCYSLDEHECALVIKGAIDKPIINPIKKVRGIGRSLLEIMDSYADVNYPCDDRHPCNILILFELNNGIDKLSSITPPENVTLMCGSGNISISGNVLGKYTTIADCSDRVDELRSILLDAGGYDNIEFELGQEKAIKSLWIKNLQVFSTLPSPFKRYDNEKLSKMVKSVETYGILTPIIVRPHPQEEGIYEIISGHNRVLAAEEAGLKTVPAIIRTMDDDAAVMVHVESNLKQRLDLNFSEKAFAYKLKNDVYRKQGKRNDLYGEPRDKAVEKSKGYSTDIIGNADNISGRTVQRYIRLTELTDDFIADVDAGKLGFNNAVEISFLTKDEQTSLRNLLAERNISITLKQAKALRKAKVDDEELTAPMMLEILNPEKPKEPAKRSPIKVNYNNISRFFSNDEELSDEEINKRIIEALEYYQQNKR